MAAPQPAPSSREQGAPAVAPAPAATPAKPGATASPLPPQLAGRAGATFDDGGHYTWRIETSGEFACVGQPPNIATKSVGVRVPPSNATLWKQLCGMAIAALAPPAPSQAAPAPTAAPAQAPAASPAAPASSGFSLDGFLTSLVDIGSQLFGFGGESAKPAATPEAKPQPAEQPAVAEPEPKKEMPATWESIAQNFDASIAGTSLTWHQAFYLPSWKRHVELADVTNMTIEEVITNVEKQAVALQRVVDHFGKPLNVHCWVRPPVYNKQIGGSSTSAHMRGAATDFHFDGMEAEEVRKVLKADPTIYPGFGENSVTWVHLDLVSTHWFDA